MFWHVLAASLGMMVTVLGAENNKNAASSSASLYCTDPDTSPNKLSSNTFHKICPSSSSSKTLSQPMCGDGSPFSFMYTSPSPFKQTSSDKIVIEFQGGGACWSSESCQSGNQLLSVSDTWNSIIGFSCSALSLAETSIDGYPVNFLCDSWIGNTDFSGYHYILVPYCTQDIHIGDNIATYDNGSVVYHHGAHNTMSVLNWVFKHFKNPSHIFLTGCSAGASHLPIVYDLINQHYNSFVDGGRTVNINAIMDSAVYLTPKYFMNNGMVNWNIDTVLKKIKFDENLEYSVQYSTYLWKHVLKRGSKMDKWGFLSHSNDPVSMEYWQAMGAGYYDDGEGNDCDSWYSDISNSITMVENSHENTESFFINGEGHCSLGLYYGLESDGFDSWAGSIVKEQTILKRSIGFGGSISSSFTTALSLFLFSSLIGIILMLSAILWKANQRMGNDKNGPLLTNEWETSLDTDGVSLNKNWKERFEQLSLKLLAPMIPFGKRFEHCPVTTFYFTTTSLYFLCMMIDGGFTHPLENPSLGPSATTLSQYGINNPTLIVEKKHIGRLISSGFMCSGVLTYLLMTFCVFRVMRHTERVICNMTTFAVVSVFIIMGSNLVYACVGNGASCASLAYVLGMNVFSIGLHKKHTITIVDVPRRPWCSTFFLTVLAVTVFPFNSWIMILVSMVIGMILPFCIIDRSTTSSASARNDSNMNEWIPKPLYLYKKIVFGSYVVMWIAFILILVGVPSSNDMYVYPYLTGCNMMYSTDVSSLAEKFGGGRRRHVRNLAENGGGNGFDFGNIGCAQFCVPHLVDKLFYVGLKAYAKRSGNDDYTVDYGMCQDVGYGDHLLDTTMKYWGFSLNVQVYDESQND